mmetsp:Transcript_25588/g.59581  ORF Transcript_25588/g.59581 Transcript_25588/m.59581 type:complete len:588 (+) Transcript_25588:61-1824(+)
MRRVCRCRTLPEPARTQQPLRPRHLAFATSSWAQPSSHLGWKASPDRDVNKHGLIRTSPEAFEYVRLVLGAKVYDICKATDLDYAPAVSSRIGNRVLLKREDQHDVHSFKIRGAYNKIAHLTAEEKARGIVACSAGNHAQGVAFASSALDISAKIFMPVMTPSIKVDAVRGFANSKSEVKLVGNNYDEAYAAAMECVQSEGRVLVHPFNDPLVIAGQGTIGGEILRQTTGEDVHAVFACVGGGGLLSGIGIYLKAVCPHIKVIGVEAADAAGMTASLMAGELVELPSVGLFADGASVRKVGDETFRICDMVADEMITVSTDEICGAIKDSFLDTRVVLEPAGALALAGLKKYVRQSGVRDKTLVAITSGANMDFDRLRFVSERADTSETLLSIQIPETPGSFIRLYRCIYPRNVTEFSYRYGGEPARIFLSFQAKTDEDAQSVMKSLASEGFQAWPLVENEMAKTHGRHLVGGRAPHPDTENEVLLRFEFPEKPGATLAFLEALPSHLNVSLFHYRSHGADVGRVLVGFQVPGKQREEFRAYLQGLAGSGFRFTEETENEVYRHFFLSEPSQSARRGRPSHPPPLMM